MKKNVQKTFNNRSHPMVWRRKITLTDKTQTTSPHYFVNVYLHILKTDYTNSIFKSVTKCEINI